MAAVEILPRELSDFVVKLLVEARVEAIICFRDLFTEMRGAFVEGARSDVLLHVVGYAQV